MAEEAKTNNQESLQIAIDFDKTLTRDPLLWHLFIEIARSRGHYVYCVTARDFTDDNLDELTEFMDKHDVLLHTLFTNGKSKLEYVAKQGLSIDIWIDDDPLSVCGLKW